MRENLIRGQKAATMAQVKEKNFQRNDIRGLYPTELNEEVACQIGLAYVSILKPKSVAIGRDMRVGSDELQRGLTRALLDSGVDVTDLGFMPIDAIYLASCQDEYDGAIMVTASHNPKEYVGIKMVGRNVRWVYSEDIYKRIIALEKGEVPSPASENKGSVSARNFMPEYVRHVLSFVDRSKMKPLKVVIDAGNGLAGLAAPEIFAHLPYKITPLFFELDGSFPNHPSNPLEPVSQIAVVQKVLEEKADLGVIMDGDTDRLLCIDEKGRVVRPDMILLLIAKQMLREQAGAGIAYTLNCSRAVPEFIKKMGGVPIRTKVGYAHVSTGLKQYNGVMGGELSSHYSYKDNQYADSGFISLLLVLQSISESGRPVSEIVREFMIYSKSDEINLAVPDTPKIIAALKEKYQDGEQDELDGLSVQYSNWWFNARASKTEPLLRLTAEAATEALLEEKKEELVSFVRAIK